MSFCFSYQKESTFGGYDPYAAIAQSAICTEDLLDVTYADGARVNVLMAQTADGYLEHPLQHRIYFDLIDDNIRVDAFMYSEEDSVADSKARCEALCATLRASYDYLYVYEWDDWFAATYSSLFENGRQDLEDGWKIYHVVWQPDGSLKLVHAAIGWLFLCISSNSAFKNKSAVERASRCLQACVYACEGKAPQPRPTLRIA